MDLTYLNGEVPKRMGYNLVPSGGNASSGVLTQMTGTGLTVREIANASGILNNDGFGNITWGAGGGASLPTNASGVLSNDGVGGLSWLKQYVESNSDFVYTVGLTGGTAQYTSIAAAVAAIQAVGNTTAIFVVKLYPGTYIDQNFSVTSSCTIYFISSDFGIYPDQTRATVALQYNNAPTSGNAYIYNNPQSGNANLYFCGISFYQSYSGASIAHLFQIPSTILGQSQIYLIICSVTWTMTNTDSCVYRNDYPAGTGAVQAFYAHRCYIATAFGSTAGSNGFCVPFYVSTNKPHSFVFEYCYINGLATGNATTPIGYYIRCAGTTQSQTVAFYSCDRIVVTGYSGSSGVIRLAYISGPGSFTCTWSDITTAVAYTVGVVAFDGGFWNFCYFCRM